MKLRTLVTALALVTSVTSITTVAEVPPGGSVVLDLRWREASAPPGTTVNKSGHDGADSLLIKQSEPKPASIALWKVENPGVTTKFYALRGKIRYQNVDGTGFLVTWNEFPANEPSQPNMRAFSRSLAEYGPFGKLSGTSDWRDLFIPFNAEGTKQPLAKLELNLVLAGAGEVEISDLRLIQFADSGAMWAAMGPGLVAANPAFSWVKWFAGGTLVALIVAAVLVPRAIITVQRRKAEQRRMRAMDV